MSKGSNLYNITNKKGVRFGSIQQTGDVVKIVFFGKSHEREHGEDLFSLVSLFFTYRGFILGKTQKERNFNASRTKREMKQ